MNHFAALLPVLFITSALASCPPPYTSLSGGCYYLSSTLAQWSDAVPACQSLSNGWLVTLDTAAKITIPGTLYSNAGQIFAETWIGIYKTAPCTLAGCTSANMIWQRSSGAPPAPIVSYTNFISTNPDVAGDMCIRMKSDNLWYDIGCSTTYRYICETVPVTPAPTSMPTVKPTSAPTSAPSVKPTFAPTVPPTLLPTSAPTSTPTLKPTCVPTAHPTTLPTSAPTSTPTVKPTCNPTVQPTASPTFLPTAAPTSVPTSIPTSKPTSIPTAQPTSVPTNQPTVSPTAAPTSIPSSLPTSIPTSLPTVAPSGQPTSMPTAEPTSAPTAEPTSAPTAEPTSTPTAEPTSAPTAEPTSAPTAEPTSIPTAEPTSTPTACPTAEPTSSPTAEPTSIPTAEPTSAPTAEPTSIPTAEPTSTPTTEPTSTPTAEPTSVPTAEPTSIPTGQPTFIPTAEPTSAPTAEPTSTPTAVPTSLPTGEPTFIPTGEPTSMPSGLPTSIPSGHPTAIPTAEPTSIPTGEPTSIPTGAPTSVPTAKPTAIPTGEPTSVPTEQPTSIPTGEPTSVPSSLPTTHFRPTFSPTVAIAPLVLSVDSAVARTSVTVSVLLSKDGIVYCAAFPTGTSAPSSIDSITLRSVSATSSSRTAIVVLTDLAAATDFDIYCYAKTLNGVAATSYSQIIANKITVSTLCCRRTTVSLSSMSYAEGKSVQDALTIALESAPLSDMTVQVSAHDISSGAAVPLYFPLSHVFGVKTSLRKSFALAATAAGKYNISVSVLSSAYRVEYASSTVVTILSSAVEPATPSLRSVSFSSSGVAIIATFDASTNRATLSNVFACAELFIFDGASNGASCQWIDNANVRITLQSGSTVKVNDDFTLLGGKIRAECALSRSECLAWATVGSSTLTIAAPAAPISPNVVISAPSTVGPCDAPVFDLTSSSGSGGRAWTLHVAVTAQGGNATALSSFFSTKYKLSPPTAVPRGTLNAGAIYFVSFTLCNFLGKCSSKTHRLLVSSDALPSVSILGLQSRSHLVNKPLLISSKAFIAFCDGSQASNSLEYSWSVSQNGVYRADLDSESIDKSKYRLSAYKLEVNAVYTVELLVRNTNTQQTNRASVQVNVQSGNLVAVVGGASSKSFRRGESIVLDASPSYDENKLVSPISSGGYTTSWRCLQVEPVMLDPCLLNITSISAGYKAVIDMGTATEKSVSVITFTIADTTRQSEASISVTLQAAQAPAVTINSALLARKVNPSEQIKLLGNVQLFAPTTSTWSIDDLSVDLNKVSLTPVTRYLSAGSHGLNLVLPSNALAAGKLSYRFTLQSEGSFASVDISVNTPPTPGLGQVTPQEGTELQTQFVFSANQWTDDDLPLTYEFGYVSGGNLLLIQSRSEASFASSSLPAGSQASNHMLSCVVRVYDSLVAMSAASVAVKVSPTTLSATDLQLQLAQQLSDSGSADSKKKSVTVFSSVINVVNCSEALHCEELNRAECGVVANTCGPCLDGYTGVVGYDNTACIIEDDVEAFTSKSCTTNNECNAWSSCVGNICVRAERACPSSCVHGTCISLHVNTGRPVVDTCYMGDELCAPSCICDAGYFGATCDMNATDIAAKQQLRVSLANSLYTAVLEDEVSAEGMEGWSATLTSVTQVANEVTEETADASLSIIEAITANGDQATAATIDSSLNVLDSMLIAASSTGSSRRRLSQSKTRRIVSMIDDLSGLVTDQMVAGQNKKSVINNMFLSSSVVASLRGGNFTISAPLTHLEELGKHATPSVTLHSHLSHDIKSSLTVLKSKLYSEDMSSNGIRVTLTSNEELAESLNIVFTIPTNNPQEYPVYVHNVTYNTTCTTEDFSTYSYTCPSNASGVNTTIYHTCNGTALTFVTRCPTERLVPSCHILDGNAATCAVHAFDAFTTTCMCSLQLSSRRRLSDHLENTGALEVASLSVLVADEFASTIVATEEFDSLADVKAVLTVILMYGCMWVGGILSILFCGWRHKASDKVKSAESALEKMKEEARQTRTAAAVKEYLSSYVKEVFPTVFRAESSLLRLYHEISKHHRYLVLFTAKGPNSDNVRMLTGVHLLTIQTMLMFMLAVLYDIQFPEDDGTCVREVTENECLSHASPFDTGKHLCDWHLDRYDEYVCSYVEPTFSWDMIILLSILVAIFTAPVNLLVDFLFMEVLSAPTADSIKVQTEDTALKRAGRRMSNAVRRASITATKAAGRVASAVKRGSRKLSGIQPMVTRVMPDATVAAHAMVHSSNSVRDLVHSARQSNEATEKIRRTTMSRVKRPAAVKGKTHIPASAISTLEELDVKRFSYYQNDTNMDETFLELCDDLQAQRKLLKRSEVDAFDTMWGIDPTGEFYRRHSTFSCFNNTQGSAEVMIREEMSAVRKETLKKVEKLRFATDIHCGLEILHTFVLDLLGRGTPAAKIFLTNFRHAMVVSRTVKALAWIAVCVMNLFFVYFSMIRGLQRGYRWQQYFLMACVVQFILEIFLYETSECAAMHFLIPNLVTAEVRSASFAMQQAVQRVCSATTDVSTIILDAPRYLFVSTNVAKRFPGLLESVIVQSYHSYCPGEIGKKWKFVSSYARTGSRVRNFAITATVLSMMKNFGAMSPTFQRVTIHSIQPLLVSLLILIWMFALSNPLFGAAILVLLVLMVAMLVRQYYIQRRAVLNEIMPVSEENSLGKASLGKEVLDKEFADVMTTSALSDRPRARSSSSDSVRKVDVIRRVSNTRPRLHSDASSGSARIRSESISGRRRLNSYESDGSLVDEMLESYFDVSSDGTDSDDMM